MSSVIPNGSYPIREFARITGVNPATLRAWERRYGIIRPLRTEKGHRFFNEDHVARVRQILYWLEQGYPIRQVRLLLDDKSNSKPSSNDQFSDDYLEPVETATQGNTPALPEPDNNWGEIKQSLEIA
ncbi:MAG: MerR family transcriptional regulator, partial [Oceanobacter sp.]